MSVRLFIGYFVALAACATIAFTSSEIDGSGTPGSLASERPASWQPLPASTFQGHSRKLLSKHVQVAQAE